jgi:hypothetical protein
MLNDLGVKKYVFQLERDSKTGKLHFPWLSVLKV